MQKGVRLVFVVCLLVTLGIVGVQAFWLRNFYRLNKDRFEKEVSLALEDGIKSEFKHRNDSIESLLFHFMMDTAEIRMTSKPSPKDGRQMYQVINARNPKDYFSFSRKDLNFPLRSQQDTNKANVARAAAQLDREQDLDHHIIFYRTQNIGHYLQGQVDSLGFDTARLRPFFAAALRQRDILEAFQFGLKDADNTLNKSPFPDSMASQYAVISKAFPTFKNKKNENFVRAYFAAPTAYLLSRTVGLVVASAVLLLTVGAAFLYLIHVIRREKKLAVIKADFVNHITHEFKTPIATVHSAVQALDRFDLLQSDPAKARRYLQLSRTELERLSDLVSKVLQISLYEQSALPLKEEPVDMDGVVADLLTIYEEHGAKGARLAYEKTTDATTVIGDRNHLYNALNNLLDNALKYGGREPRVRIGLQREKGWLVVSVADNGPGIKREHQALVFDRFYRAPGPATAGVKGFGLGLSYVKDVLQKHKGWCRVESGPGAGSTFILGIPLIE